MTSYCASCGAECSAPPCPHCGHGRTTDTAPSREPCTYCGSRPTWRVEWRYGDNVVEAWYLCAACDERDAAADL